MNGLAEKGVQIIKRMLKKATETGSDPHLALLNYRAAPLECGKSPAELLMNRKLRTRFPSAEHLLEKKERCPINQRRLQAYNRTTKPLCRLVQDDVVRIKCDGQRVSVAKVIKETAPRSYEVLTEYGNTLRRNRCHLLKVPHDGRDGLETGDTDGRRVQPNAEHSPPSSTAEQGQTSNTPVAGRGADKSPLPETVYERPHRHVMKLKRLIEEC